MIVSLHTFKLSCPSKCAGIAILVIFSLFIIVAIAIPSKSAFSQDNKVQDDKAAIAEPEKAVGRYIGDYMLVNQAGKSFRLKEFFTGKPLVMSFIYTSCGHICPTITMNLKKAIKESASGGKDFGAKFNAISIGFDVQNDTPEKMKEYGSNFTDDFKDWIFAAGNKDTIDKLAKDVGFYYKKVDGGFDHLNLVTIIDKDGKIYKQVYGMDFKPQDILQPMYQSLSGQKGAQIVKPSGITGRLLVFCYKYDEATGTYKLDYAMLVTLLMGPIFLGITTLLIIYLFHGNEIKKFVSKKVSQP